MSISTSENNSSKLQLGSLSVLYDYNLGIKSINFGRQTSYTVRAIPNLVLYDDGTSRYGLGISNSQLDYVTQAGSHVFYVSGLETLKISDSVFTYKNSAISLANHTHTNFS